LTMRLDHGSCNCRKRHRHHGANGR
jgi:hypothetical protein